MNYDTMSDRELDAAVAERVFGYYIDRFDFTYCDKTKACEVWLKEPSLKDLSPCDHRRASATMNPKPFSTSIADAWAVVEKMREEGYRLDFDNIHGYWTARIGNPQDGNWNEWGSSEHDCAPRAICLAALEAKEHP